TELGPRSAALDADPLSPDRAGRTGVGFGRARRPRLTAAQGSSLPAEKIGSERPGLPGPLSFRNRNRVVPASDTPPAGDLARRNRQLEALYAISRTVNASLELRDVLRLALEQVLQLSDYPSGVIRLLAPATGELVLAA